MRRLVVLCLVLAMIALGGSSPTTNAQTGGACNQSLAVNTAASGTATLVSGVASQVVHVCGYQITGDTASMTITIKSGTTSLTGAMLVPANGPLTYGNGGATVIYGVGGSGLSVVASTGSATGVITIGQF